MLFDLAFQMKCKYCTMHDDGFQLISLYRNEGGVGWWQLGGGRGSYRFLRFLGREEVHFKGLFYKKKIHSQRPNILHTIRICSRTEDSYSGILLSLYPRRCLISFTKPIILCNLTMIYMPIDYTFYTLLAKLCSRENLLLTFEIRRVVQYSQMG